MSLVPMLDLLRPAREKGYALPAFECWNSASIYGAVAAAAEGGFPLILQASPVEYGRWAGRMSCGGSRSSTRTASA